MIDRAHPVKAGCARHGMGENRDRTARRAERRVGRTEERDHRCPERRRQVGNARIAGDERVKLSEERRQQLGAVPPREARRPRVGAHRLGERRVLGSAEQDRRAAGVQERSAEFDDALPRRPLWVLAIRLVLTSGEDAWQAAFKRACSRG